MTNIFDNDTLSMGNDGAGEKLSIERSQLVEQYARVLFDEDYYRGRYPDMREAEDKIDLFAHYIAFGWREGRWANAYFDPVWYMSQLAGQEIGISLLHHYAQSSPENSFDPSKAFHSVSYLKAYPDVANSSMPPLVHFLLIGRGEGRRRWRVPLTPIDRQANALIDTGLFDEDWYFGTNLDLDRRIVDGAEHFVLFGHSEGRNPNVWFDLDWYMAHHAVPGTRLDALFHYCSTGWLNFENPGPNFSVKTYLEKYPDVAAKHIEPLADFISGGQKLGRRPFRVANLNKGRRLRFDRDAKFNIHPSLRLFAAAPIEPFSGSVTPHDLRSLDIHWLIPDFAPGAGGHMTIFRVCRELELNGHKVTIWLVNTAQHSTPSSAYEDAVKYFQTLKADFRVVDENFYNISCDVMVATSWETVWVVCRHKYVGAKFYFVQDFEPDFYPRGSLAISAEETYRMGISCICASPWLEKIVRQNFRQWAKSFYLAYDPQFYFETQIEKKNEIPKIAVYARRFTERRCVELALLALEQLAERGISFQVEFFGSTIEEKSCPFPAVDHGVLDAQNLGELYRDCDLGLVFSATNYSLVPQEMMACGLPVIEMSTESTFEVFPEGVVALAGPHPNDIADKLQMLLGDSSLREQQRVNARLWVEQFTWSKVGRDIDSIIKSRLSEIFNFPKPALRQQAVLPKASVIIPTYNPGSIIFDVLDAVKNQRTAWDFEIVLIDSQSTDGSFDELRKLDFCTVHQIEKREFNHGGTRNLAASMSRGEFIAVLTQDAKPVDDDWLYNLVSCLEHYPNAGGAFGKHVAWPNASPYTKRDLVAHFRSFSKLPLYLDKLTDIERWNSGDVSWRQTLHFYSDNNSCMRRSVWEKVPYPFVEFGEDQLWADQIIREGYGRVYVPSAMVYHSHDYDEDENRERSKTEAAFFLKYFGYELCISIDDARRVISALNDDDLYWGFMEGVDEDVVRARLALNESRVLGYLDAFLEASRKGAPRV